MPERREMVVRFLRGRESESSTDDVLRIIKLGENSVRTIYKEYADDGAPTTDVLTMNYQQLALYLYRIFWLLGLDEDPFTSVQFLLPGYPSILIKVETLRANMPQLMEYIMSSCWSWPAIGRNDD